MASICNNERERFGGMNGHVGFVHTFSGARPPAQAQLFVSTPFQEQNHELSCDTRQSV